MSKTHARTKYTLSAGLACLLLFPFQEAMAHARLKTPVPRNNNAGIKTGPCGNVARTVNPTQFTQGQTITVTWEETINHPGRYYFSLSQANDTNFVRLLEIPDNQNQTNNLPHQYSTTLTLPANVTCEACTLQMIQSMEENPAAPTFYYSCADVRIVANTPTPTPTPTPEPTPPPTSDPDLAKQETSSLTGEAAAIEGGACGRVASGNRSSGKSGSQLWYLALLFMPLFVVSLLKRRLAPSSLKR